MKNTFYKVYDYLYTIESLQTLDEITLLSLIISFNENKQTFYYTNKQLVNRFGNRISEKTIQRTLTNLETKGFITKKVIKKKNEFSKWGNTRIITLTDKLTSTQSDSDKINSKEVKSVEPITITPNINKVVEIKENKITSTIDDSQKINSNEVKPVEPITTTTTTLKVQENEEKEVNLSLIKSEYKFRNWIESEFGQIEGGNIIKYSNDEDLINLYNDFKTINSTLGIGTTLKVQENEEKEVNSTIQDLLSLPELQNDNEDYIFDSEIIDVEEPDFGKYNNI
jgi:hypothetical protein